MMNSHLASLNMNPCKLEVLTSNYLAQLFRATTELHEKISSLPFRSQHWKSEHVVMTSQALNYATSNQSVGIVATLSRAQVLQFLNSDSVPSTPSSKTSPLLNLLPTAINSSRQIINTPVMHPNLVYTLKSILSPKTSAAFDNTNTSEDSRCGVQSDKVSELAEMQGYEQENFLASTDNNGKASSASLRSRDGSLSLELATVVPVDMIQNRRPYQCAFTGCQRTFKNPQTMRMHHKTHSGGAEAAFQAGISGSPLKAPVHNKKTASRCPVCHRTFVGLYELRRHYGRKHSAGEKRHACRKCGRRFHVEVDVRDHEKLCGKPIACKCGLKFAFKCNLVAHKRSHPNCEQGAAMAEKRPTPSTSTQIQSETEFSETVSAQAPSLKTAVAADLVPARLQFESVPPLAFSECASSSSTVSSNMSSSSTFGEPVRDFDTNCSNTCHQYYAPLSSELLQADSYIKFPIDHYLLAASLSTSVHRVRHRLSK